MSHVTMYSGLTNERPSSRVRAPPGGHSNNIFGGGSVEEASNKSAINKKENMRPISNVFGDSSAQTPSNETPVKKGPADNVKSILFGADSTQQQVNAAKKRTGINPITGRNYDEENEDEQKKAMHQASDASKDENSASRLEKEDECKKQQVHTSSKVSQPPGGRSTRLW